MTNRLADAFIPERSPSDVMIAPHGVAPDGNDAARPTVALARVNQPELTVWLRDAINQVLIDLPIQMERPTGTLLERGTWTQHETQVWVADWYGTPNHLLVAECDDNETARRLTTLLNALLTAT